MSISSDEWNVSTPTPDMPAMSPTVCDSARRACTAEPGNERYRQLLLQIQQGAQAYDAAGEGFGFRRVNLGNNNLCMSLCVANLVCNLCCGGRFLCC